MFHRHCYAVLALATVLAICFRGEAVAGIITNNPDLPPVDGEYRTPADVHAQYNPGILITLSDIRHFGFVGIVRLPSGPDEIETFGSTVQGLATVGVNPPVPATLIGPVQVVAHNKIGQTVGTFQTEMLSMDLIGNIGGPVMIRESPTLPSLGQTTITDIGGGLYHIDSFFDVFTELSLDGGQTWAPSQTSTRVELISPKPGTCMLLGCGLLGVILAKRRRPAP